MRIEGRPQLVLGLFGHGSELGEGRHLPGEPELVIRIQQGGGIELIRTPDTVWQLLSQLPDFISLKNRHCELWGIMPP